MRKREAAGLLAAMTLTTGSSWPEVTRRYGITSEGVGAREAAAVDGCSADRWLSENATRRTAGLMKTLTGGRDVRSISITRADRNFHRPSLPREPVQPFGRHGGKFVIVLHTNL